MKERLLEVKRLSGELAKAGLTPLDLCSWTTLLVLSKRCSDIDRTFELEHEIDAAMKRKAEDLDDQGQTDFYTKMLGG